MPSNERDSMKLTRFGLLALMSVLGATGCVSQAKFDELKSREHDLMWRLEAAEKAGSKSEAEKKMIQREVDIVREEARVAREKLALANDALVESKKDVDEELKDRLAELQSKSPSKQELSPYGGVVLESGILFAPGRH